MALNPIKVTIFIDSKGACIDPNNPMMLDSLLAYCLAPFHTNGIPPDRDQAPDEIPLPLGRWECVDPESWGWCASALLPDGETIESVYMRRRKMQVNRLELTTGTVNTSIGTMKEWNVPVPITLCQSLTGYALGDRKRVDQVLRKNLKYVGRERQTGHGRVTTISVEWCDEDLSLVQDGKAARFLPCPDGSRLVRPRAPYWNIIGRVPHCDVGDPAPAWLTIRK
jgi:CRISPR type IV-associated protein Csf3